MAPRAPEYVSNAPSATALFNRSLAVASATPKAAAASRTDAQPPAARHFPTTSLVDSPVPRTAAWPQGVQWFHQPVSGSKLIEKSSVGSARRRNLRSTYR